MSLFGNFNNYLEIEMFIIKVDYWPLSQFKKEKLTYLILICMKVNEWRMTDFAVLYIMRKVIILLETEECN